MGFHTRRYGNDFFVGQCHLSRFSRDLPHSDVFHPKRFSKCDPFARPLTRKPVVQASECSMGLMARVDAPLFHDVTMRCFHPLIFSISQSVRLSKSHNKVQNTLSSTCGPLQSPHQGHTFLHWHGRCPMEQSRRKYLTRVRTAGCKPAPETKVSHSSPVQVCASSCLLFSIDASFTSTRANIHDHIANAAKLALWKMGRSFCAAKEARGNKRRGGRDLK